MAAHDLIETAIAKLKSDDLTGMAGDLRNAARYLDEQGKS
jgi:hypothetical protein